jgi:predicted nucleic acid-binding protein
MKFLLDTDICSAHMRRPAKLAHRFIQYTGQIAISTVTLAELYPGAYKHSQTNRLLALIADLLQEVQGGKSGQALFFVPWCKKQSLTRFLPSRISP